jgi:predicted GNAT family acetyltransferase
MSEMQIVVRDNPEAMRFEAVVDGRLAIAEYRLPAGAILFSHTEVPEQLEGRGVGRALVLAGLAAARERGLKVIPLCTFFAGYMKRHPETHDLLHPDYRRVLGLD